MKPTVLNSCRAAAANKMAKRVWVSTLLLRSNETTDIIGFGVGELQAMPEKGYRT